MSLGKEFALLGYVYNNVCTSIVLMDIQMLKCFLLILLVVKMSFAAAKQFHLFLLPSHMYERFKFVYRLQMYNHTQHQL